MKSIRSFSVLVVLLVAACGGGGGGGGQQPQTFNVKIPSTGSLDGAVWSDNRALSDIYPQPGHGPSGNPVQRAVYHFDLSTLPPGAVVRFAKLEAQQFLGTSGDPYAEMGPLVLDHIDMTGAAFDFTLFTGHTLTNNVAVLSTTNALELKTTDVTVQVRADVAAGRTSSSFRLHFTTETGPFDVNNRSVFFNDGEDTAGATAETPVLSITYE